MGGDAAHPNAEIATRLNAIYALHRKANDFRLTNSPYNDLLAALGDPHLRLPPVIHLAGTNGKGSTLAFLKAIYEAAGYSVHTYTSPHLTHFNERIGLNGNPIDDATLLRYLDMTERANAGRAVTFFEYTTAMAFKAMADHPADICLIETGLGGRLDCTNIIPDPIATVITSIGYDHMEFLGHEITQIATEKAGIMKLNTPCIIAPQIYPETMPVFENHAAAMESALYPVTTRDDLPPLGLIGAHQQQNAATALETVAVLQGRLPVSDDAMRHGLANARWRGRMEKITSGALAHALHEGTELWFDCGHNAEGAMTIGAQLATWKRAQPNRPIHIIMGLAGDKDPNEFLKHLWDWADTVTCVDLPNARTPQSGSDLAGKITAQKPVLTAPDVASALHHITDGNALILVCGSVYLYGQMC